MHAINGAPVNKIIPFSLVDGPGNRSAIFLQGCNLNCLYCHNPETINLCISCGECVKVCPTAAVHLDHHHIVHYDIDKCCLCDECIKVCKLFSSPRIQYLTAQKTFDRLQPYLPFIRGVTVSGGECTLHHDYLVELFQLIKSANKTTFVDTNGQLSFRKMPDLVKTMDKAMVDLKSARADEYLKLTSKPMGHVLDNIEYLASLDKIYEIRTVVIPEDSVL